MSRKAIGILVVLGAVVALVTQWSFSPNQRSGRVGTGLEGDAANHVHEAELSGESASAPLQQKSKATIQVHDSRLKFLVEPDLPVTQRITPDIAAKVPAVSDTGDLEILSGILTDASDHDTVRNEVANLLRRSQYSGLNTALYQVLDNPAEKPRFRSFAVQHLWQQTELSTTEDRERILQKLRELLNDRHVEVQREALLALVRMKDPIGMQTATEWLTSENHVAHRDLAIRCVYELDLREKMSAVRAYVRDSNEVVRIAAIVALSQWNDEKSRAAFEAASKSPIVRVQRAGKAALERLSNRPVYNDDTGQSRR